MKLQLIFIFTLFVNHSVSALNDSIKNNYWIRNKISFGRSQHIQYIRGSNKTNTISNKTYYTAFSPLQIRGFKPFVSLNYAYFFTRDVCYTCAAKYDNSLTEKQLHFINFATLGIGFTQEITFKSKSGKERAFIFGASIERFLFKRALIFNQSGDKYSTTPFTSTNKFFNQYFFKDVYGVRVYNANDYKVFLQISGLLLRNERLYYAPSRHNFRNFMLGFNIYLK